MVRLETNPHFCNRIACSPGVQPFIRPDGEPVDFTPICRERFSVSGVVLLSNGEDALGVFEATAIGPGGQAFQGHTLFSETCRGRKAIDTAKAMLGWMFAHGATILWGSTPRENRKARWFNRQVGFAIVGGDEETEIFEMRAA